MSPVFEFVKLNFILQYLKFRRSPLRTLHVVHRLFLASIWGIFMT